MASNFSKLSVLSTQPKRSTTWRPIKASSALEDGCITYKESITYSAKRESSHTIRRFDDLIPASVSTLRSAIELKAVFDQIQAAEKAGNLSPEEKKKLEEQAAEKGLQALFKVRSKFNYLEFSSHAMTLGN